MSSPEILGFLSGVRIGDTAAYELGDDMDRAEPVEAGRLNARVLEKYGVDLSAEYAGIPLAHPFGKGAGQLSLNENQVSSDRESGLAFTVLKSAVAVTETGEVGIDDWERSAPSMVLEPRKSRDGRTAWTVTWKGRGWDRGFDAYLEFYRESLRQNPRHVVIPSLMVDVTDPDRAVRQARFCLGRLMDVHRSNSSQPQFLVEIDISPTLFTLPNSREEDVVMSWVRTSVGAFAHALAREGGCLLKLPNADRGAEFQVGLARAGIDAGAGRLAGLIVGNRLFDPEATFEDQKGIAYGGYDLSNANLAALDALASAGVRISLIGTGNICSGRMMAEYAVRGCTAGEIHTFFQYPPSAYRAPVGTGGRTLRALRELIYHPQDGIVATILQLEKAGIMHRSRGILRFRELPGILSAIKGAHQ